MIEANKIKDGGWAFPMAGNGDNRATIHGMTLRDYFAAKAMQGLLASLAHPDSDIGIVIEDEIVRHAFRVADAMLEAR